MAKHRSQSIEFKRQVAQEFIAGETLHGVMKRRLRRRVLELQPTFRFNRQFAGVDCAPELAPKLSNALSAAGLPD